MDKGVSSHFTLIIFQHNAGFLMEFFFKCYTLSSNNFKGTLSMSITYIDIAMVVNYNVSGKHHYIYLLPGNALGRRFFYIYKKTGNSFK